MFAPAVGRMSADGRCPTQVNKESGMSGTRPGDPKAEGSDPHRSGQIE